MALAALTSHTWPPTLDAPDHRFARISPGGQGFRFNYFHPETSNDRLLLTAHSLALIHFHPSDVIRPLQTWNTFDLLISIFHDNQGAHWFPYRELINIFLVLRGTSRPNLIFMSRWYADEVEKLVLKSIRSQAMNRTIRLSQQTLLVSLGCVCLMCEPLWLHDGWVCPWMLTSFNTRWD